MTTIAEASYTPSRLVELAGNPLAEALPPRLSPDELVSAVTRLPDYERSQREWSVAERQLAARRLQACIVPSPEYQAVYEALHSMLLMGYAARNPLEPSVVAWQYDVARNATAPVERTSAETFFLTGLSGIGKTTLLRALLGCFPQVIEHHAYHGKPFRQRQLVYIHVDIPADASRKQLCLSILDAVDEALRLAGDDRYGKQYRRRQTTVDQMQDAIRTICATYCVGALLIDELQNLNVAKAGGARVLMQYFDTLANQVRVPILTIGTPAALGLFDSQFRSARRVGTGGFIELRRPTVDSDYWRHLATVAWRFQWIQRPLPLTAEIVDDLYGYSQGLPAMLFRLMQLANEEAIARGKESIDRQLLDKVYKSHFRLLRHALSALRRGQVGQYEDLMTAAEFFEASDGRSSLKLLMRIAQRSGKSDDAARALSAFTRDAEYEHDLTEEEKRKLAELRKQLDGDANKDKPGTEGKRSKDDDDGEAVA